MSLADKLQATNHHNLAKYVEGEDVKLDQLRKQLDKIDIPRVVDLFQRAQQTAVLPNPDEILPVSPIIWKDTSHDYQNRIKSIGCDASAQGKVGAVILSGGQGTRLGFDGPKGMYCIGLISHKSIFQIHIEKIIKMKNVTGARRIPVYIMTSDLNDKIIREYFHTNNYFGYPEKDVFFFEQGLQYCLSNEYTLLLDSDSTLSMAPDGNGGIYHALDQSGALKDMIDNGVEHLHIYGIDNVLTRAVDPAFIGLCIDNDAEIGNKVVWRAKNEKVGVTVSDVHGRMKILEYSEIPAGLAEAMNPGSDKLLYGAGNICNHYMSVAFIKNIVMTNLIESYHIANKKIPNFDPVEKKMVYPTKNNGMKLELFIFDVFPLAKRWTVMEVERFDEFAPVKNEPGNASDSPDTARFLLSEQSKRWLANAGAILVDSSNNDVTPYAGDKVQKLETNSDVQCEVSPLLSVDGTGLAAYSGKTITLPCFLE